MMHRVLARLPRHVLAAKPYRNISSLRTYAQHTQQLQEAQKPQEDRRDTQNADATPPARSIEASADGLSLKMMNGKKHLHDIDGRWLRDQCACPECRNVDTAQRKINVFKNADAGTIAKVRDTDAEKTSFEVTFKDGHTNIFPLQLFEQRDYGTNRETADLHDRAPEIQYWQSSISSDPPTVEHAEIQTGDGMAKLLAKIRISGFCFVDNMPATPEASQSLLEQIGPIRNTHYGGFYDFTSDLSSKDTAYTSESLEPHTDTTYFTDPIGLQALHLLSHTEGTGGLSSLVDGFSAARQLYSHDRDAYIKLSRSRVWAHASGNEGISIQPATRFPILSHKHTSVRDLKNDVSRLRQVRWNTADRAGVDAGLGKDICHWYDSASAFDAILSKKENQYWFQLQPGKMLIFDNWRVLHGRSAFTGKRRICGGYINRDDWISKYRMTNFSKEEVMATTIIA